MAAFGCYFCMYAFRKPFTAAEFASPEPGVEAFKPILVASQVMGYTISKFIGIRVIAEMPRHRRAVSILVLVGVAELALLLFGIVPRPWNAACLFLNGLPLGMIFGLVLGFLEGRRHTEALAAGLCASFIVADGASKSLGAWLLQMGVPEHWMPAAAGGLFLVPLFLFVGMLTRIPPPSAADLAARAERFVMDREQRWRFLRRYAFGIGSIMVIYLLVTILRSVRADFAPELWRGLGTAAAPADFSRSEMLVAAVVMLASAVVIWISDNRTALLVSLGTCGAGFLLLISALVALQQKALGGFGFMVLTGLGLYLPYVAIHTTVFERFLAMTRERANVGFLMYVVDAVGYLGYVAIMLVRNQLQPGGDLLPAMVRACWVFGLVSLLVLAAASLYFVRLRTEAGHSPDQATDL